MHSGRNQWTVAANTLLAPVTEIRVVILKVPYLWGSVQGNLMCYVCTSSLLFIKWRTEVRKCIRKLVLFLLGSTIWPDILHHRFYFTQHFSTWIRCMCYNNYMITHHFYQRSYASLSIVQLSSSYSIFCVLLVSDLLICPMLNLMYTIQILLSPHNSVFAPGFSVILASIIWTLKKGRLFITSRKFFKICHP